jgi:Zn-dependent protease
LIIAAASLLLGIAYLVSKKMDLLTPYNLALYGIMGGFVIILHDLTHRYYAHKYHAVVEYKFWGLGAVIMFVTAFLFGLVYAVPARTIINDVKKLGVREQAIIYMSGPMMSAVLAVAFILLVPAGGFFATVALLGVSMNLLTAVYSLMPIDPLDGVRVYKWKKPVWLVAFLPLLVLYVLVTVYLL